MAYLLAHMFWLWIAVAAVAAFVEAATAALVSIWFTLGALAACIAAYIGATVPTQILLFVLISIAALAAARPLAKRFLDPHHIPTNADRVLKMTGKVTEEIDNASSRGAVYVDGKAWTARGEDGEVIPVDTIVDIVRMEGVKLYVRPHTAAKREAAACQQS